MYTNNNINPLPWYDNVAQQDVNKKYTSDKIYSLLTPINNILPFQLKRFKRANPILSFLLKGQDGSTCYDITDDIKASGLQVDPYLDFDLIVNYNRQPLTTEIIPGFYYAEMTDGVETWYSEVFRMVESLEDYIKIEYWNKAPLENVRGEMLIDYTGGYRNVLYIDSFVSHPNYVFEKEAEELDGVVFAEKQTAKKVYRFQVSGPEYMTDVFQTIFLADNIKISQNGVTYNATNFITTHQWDDAKRYAVIENEFDTTNVFKTIATTIEDPKPALTFSFRTTDAVTRAAIPNTQVEFNIGNNTITTLTTNEQGSASFDMNVTKEEWELYTAPQVVSSYTEDTPCCFYDMNPNWRIERTEQIGFRTGGAALYSTDQRQVIYNTNSGTPYNGIMVYVVSGNLIVNVGGVEMYNMAIIPYNEYLITIRKADQKASVKVQLISQLEYYRHDSVITEWSIPSRIIFGAYDTVGTDSFKGGLIMLRAFNSYLTDAELAEASFANYAIFYTLSESLMKKCVYSFKPHGLPIENKGMWISDVGNYRLTHNGGAYTKIMENPLLLVFYKNSNYHNTFIEDSVDLFDYEYLVTNGLDYSESLVKNSDLTFATPSGLPAMGDTWDFVWASPNADNTTIVSPTWAEYRLEDDTLILQENTDSIPRDSMVFLKTYAGGRYYAIGGYLSQLGAEPLERAITAIGPGFNLRNKKLVFTNVNLPMSNIWNTNFLLVAGQNTSGAGSENLLYIGDGGSNPYWNPPQGMYGVAITNVNPSPGTIITIASGWPFMPSAPQLSENYTYQVPDDTDYIVVSNNLPSDVSGTGWGFNYLMVRE